MVKKAIDEDLAEGYRDMDARELRKLNQVLFVFNSYLQFTFMFPNVLVAIIYGDGS